MALNKIEYKELTKAKISDARNVVISACSKGGFTIAQQLEVTEGNKLTSVFMSGAFHIDDLHGLYNIRDAVNLAIDLAEKEKAEESDWD